MQIHYSTFTNMAREVTRTGHHYFDGEATRFFNAKYTESVCHVEYTGVRDEYYLIESIRLDRSTPREYRTLRVTVTPNRCPDCDTLCHGNSAEIFRYVENAGSDMRYRTLAQARKALNRHLSAMFGTSGISHV